MTTECRAPERIGVIRLAPQTEIGTAATLVAADGLIVRADPEWEAIGEGMIDTEEGENPLPGSQEPILGSYGEALTFQVSVPVAAENELTTDHALVRLCRACGCDISLAAGELEIEESDGACVGFGAGDIVPLTVETVQRGGLLQRWIDCVGALTQVAGESAGGGVMLTFRLIGRVDTKEAAGALPSVDYPGQEPMLSARNGRFEEDGSDLLGGLYSWTLTTGLEVQEVEDQTAAAGQGLPFVFGTTAAELEVNRAMLGGVATDLWNKFLAMEAIDDLEIGVEGQSEHDVEIFTLAMPKVYVGPSDAGNEAGHRTDGRTFRLKSDGAEKRWKITIREDVEAS